MKRAPTLLAGPRRSQAFVAATLGVALAVRWASVFATRATYAPVTDSLNFDLIASSLSNGHGFGNALVPPAVGPSAFRGPGYPGFLAAVYKVVGDHAWTAGRLATQLVGVVVVALIGIVATQLLGRKVGAVALAIAAVHPMLILYGTSLNIENLLVALELGGLAAALQHRRSPRGLLWPIVAGACIGAAGLTRESGFLVLPTAMLLVIVARPRWNRHALAPAAAVLVVAAVVVAPWTVRNLRTFHALIPVSTSTGYALAGTYNATAMDQEALWVPPPVDPTLFDDLEALPKKGEVEIDDAMRKASLDYIRDHPSSVAKSFFWNTVRLFDLQGAGPAVTYATYVPYPKGLTRIAVYSSWLVMALAVVAAAMGLLRAIPRSVWLFPLLVYLNLAFLAGNYRYRAAIEPLFVIAAAAAVVALTELWSAKRSGRARDGDERMTEREVAPAQDAPLA